jgi:hypothetical protein
MKIELHRESLPQFLHIAVTAVATVHTDKNAEHIYSFR